MTNGRRAETITIEEQAARKIARALGYGSGWNAPTVHVAETGETAIENDGDTLTIASRGCVEEQAGAQVEGAPRIREFHKWEQTEGRLSLPMHRPSFGVLAALSYAGLTPAEQAVLLMYAGELHHWPTVERYMRARGHTRTAAADGMSDILWPGYNARSAERDNAKPGPRSDKPAVNVTIGERALELGIRKQTYLAQFNAARRQLRKLLREASAKFLRALNGNQQHHAKDTSIRGECLGRLPNDPADAVPVTARQLFKLLALLGEQQPAYTASQSESEMRLPYP